MRTPPPRDRAAALLRLISEGLRRLASTEARIRQCEHLLAEVDGRPHRRPTSRLRAADSPPVARPGGRSGARLPEMDRGAN